jgi:hypothetical protein
MLLSTSALSTLTLDSGRKKRRSSSESSPLPLMARDSKTQALPSALVMYILYSEGSKLVLLCKLCFFETILSVSFGEVLFGAC